MSIYDTGLDHNIPNLDERMKNLSLDGVAPKQTKPTNRSFGSLADQAALAYNPFYKRINGGKKTTINKRKISKKSKKNKKRFTKRKH